MSAIFVLLAGLAACLPGLFASEHCYNGPPVLLDCVTNPALNTFCHVHFQFLNDTDCDYTRPVPECSGTIGCIYDETRRLYRMTVASSLVYAGCKTPPVPGCTGCWHCAASLVCRIDYFYTDGECTDRIERIYYWGAVREGCY